jgi:hypothetical protein
LTIPFKGLHRGNNTRPLIVVISCAMVVAGFVSLQIVGRRVGFVFQEWDIYEAIYGVIAAIIGLLFWGKHAAKTRPPTRPPTTS